jgi:DNA-binding NarL/FixJ family response regulator
MSSRTRIVVVDDSPLFVEAMAVQLDECDDLQLVGSAMDGPAALALLQWAACDVVVLAHPLGGDEGLGVARSVLALRPGPAAVMLSDGSRDGCIL